MTLPLAFIWVLIISAFSVLGAYYARKFGRPDALVVFYVTTVIFSNIAASKVILFDLVYGELYASVTVLTFSVTFLLTDIVNERFGKRETQRMILLAVFCQAVFVLYSYLALRALPAPFFANQQAFEIVMGGVPRLMLASFVAFFVSENFDAYLFQWFKNLTRGRHLWMRNAFSSLPAMLADGILFNVIAFYGVFPLIPLTIGLTLIKWAVGVINIPFMYLSRAVLEKG